MAGNSMSGGPGPKKGERRGGRKAGVPNKVTAARQRAEKAIEEASRGTPSGPAPKQEVITAPTVQVNNGNTKNSGTNPPTETVFKEIGDQFFRFLGYHKEGGSNVYNFYSYDSKSVISLAPTQMGKAKLMQLAPLEFWEEKLNVNFDSDQEVWNEFDEDTETLNINKIKTPVHGK